MLDTKYLTVLPQDIDPKVVGPVLCAGVTAYKAVKNANLKPGEWLCVIGAGGGLGHLAVQYGLAVGAKVLGIDAGDSKKTFIESLGAQFLDFTKSKDLVEDVKGITSGGSHAAVVTSGHPMAFKHAADILRIGGALSLVGWVFSKSPCQYNEIFLWHGMRWPHFQAVKCSGVLPVPSIIPTSFP